MALSFGHETNIRLIFIAVVATRMQNDPSKGDCVYNMNDRYLVKLSYPEVKLYTLKRKTLSRLISPTQKGWTAGKLWEKVLHPMKIALNEK